MEKLTRKEFQDGISIILDQLGFVKDSPTVFTQTETQMTGMQMVIINGQAVQNPGTQVTIKRVFEIGDWGSILTPETEKEGRLVEVSITKHIDSKPAAKISEWVLADTDRDLESLKIEIQEWARL